MWPYLERVVTPTIRECFDDYLEQMTAISPRTDAMFRCDRPRGDAADDRSADGRTSEVST